MTFSRVLPLAVRPTLVLVAAGSSPRAALTLLLCLAGFVQRGRLVIFEVAS